MQAPAAKGPRKLMKAGGAALRIPSLALAAPPRKRIQKLASAALDLEAELDSAAADPLAPHIASPLSSKKSPKPTFSRSVPSAVKSPPAAARAGSGVPSPATSLASLRGPAGGEAADTSQGVAVEPAAAQQGEQSTPGGQAAAAAAADGAGEAAQQPEASKQSKQGNQSEAQVLESLRKQALSSMASVSKAASQDNKLGPARPAVLGADSSTAGVQLASKSQPSSSDKARLSAAVKGGLPQLPAAPSCGCYLRPLLPQAPVLGSRSAVLVSQPIAMRAG